MEFAIRRFERADAPAVAAMIARTFRVSNAPDYPPEEIEALCRRETPEYVAERASWTHFYVACAPDGEILGCGAIGPYRGREDESCLFSIFVRPECQGRGLGTRIMETLEADPFFLRARRVEIPASITGCGFYRKLGYDYKDGIDVPDEDGLYHLEKRREGAPRTGGDNAAV